jgi:hypothetical protein
MLSSNLKTVSRLNAPFENYASRKWILTSKPFFVSYSSVYGYFLSEQMLFDVEFFSASNSMLVAWFIYDLRFFEILLNVGFQLFSRKRHFPAIPPSKSWKNIYSIIPDKFRWYKMKTTGGDTIFLKNSSKINLTLFFVYSCECKWACSSKYDCKCSWGISEYYLKKKSEKSHLLYKWWLLKVRNWNRPASA